MGTYFPAVLRATSRLLLAAALTSFPTLGMAGVPDPVFQDGFELTARIISPSDEETRTAGMPIPFVGSASEPANLVWVSSLDGQFGTGTSFSAALSVGDHVITLTATNAGGATAQSRIALSVRP